MKHVFSRQELIAALKQRGFGAQDEQRYAYAESYLHAASGVKVSVKFGEKNPLVVHPCCEGRISTARTLDGVLFRKRPYYHSTSLDGFPKRLNRGKNEIGYGLDFGFSSATALDAFLDALLASSTSEAPTAEEDIAAATNLPVDETERETVIAARRGQGRFREALDSLWAACAVTGCANPALLRASHIKPWRDSDNHDRLFPYNGLLLAVHIDAAFDKGLISFDDDGCILVDDSRLSDEDSKALGIHSKLKLRDIHDMHKPYLAEHRRLHRFEG